MNDDIKIIGWKFGGDNITVKYERGVGMYTLKTLKEPRSELYKAAVDVANETLEVMEFKFSASLSVLAVGRDEEGEAVTITLYAGTALGKTAELKCPQISRRKIIDFLAIGAPPLPGVDANTAIERYADHETFNLTIDIFLNEAERFVRDCGKKERGLFDEDDLEARNAKEMV
ncbi:MAG: hypothetical protein LBK73_12190 [Treponema sp.]|jgi:hypothetical protein|nr:hypothetical protein [Treponema sp.]